jgi:hypothetical protein
VLFLLATHAEAEEVAARLRANFASADWAVNVENAAKGERMFRVSVVALTKSASPVSASLI